MHRSTTPESCEIFCASSWSASSWTRVRRNDSYVFMIMTFFFFFFFSSRRRHTRLQGDWSSDVCSSDLSAGQIDGIDALISLAPRITADSLARANRLIGICRFGVGYDMVDVKACTEVGRASCRERV